MPPGRRFSGLKKRRCFQYARDGCNPCNMKPKKEVKFKPIPPYNKCLAAVAAANPNDCWKTIQGKTKLAWDKTTKGCNGFFQGKTKEQVVKQMTKRQLISFLRSKKVSLKKVKKMKRPVLVAKALPYAQ